MQLQDSAKQHANSGTVSALSTCFSSLLEDEHRSWTMWFAAIRTKQHHFFVPSSTSPSTVQVPSQCKGGVGAEGVAARTSASDALAPWHCVQPAILEKRRKPMFGHLTFGFSIG